LLVARSGEERCTHPFDAIVTIGASSFAGQPRGRERRLLISAACVRGGDACRGRTGAGHGTKHSRFTRRGAGGLQVLRWVGEQRGRWA
jgi:hypothetical protein